MQDQLTALFDAERTARKLHGELLEQEPSALTKQLQTATNELLQTAQSEESELRLTRIAYLLGDLEGPAVVDTLIDILGSSSAGARIAAGEALEGLAFDRFKEVALGIERALERLAEGNPALSELPFLLAEVAEPGCVKLLGRFLKHRDAEAVAAAIEALAELGDPSAIAMLAPLQNDRRQVQIDEEEGDGERVAIGDLAFEAMEILGEVAETAPAAPGAHSASAPRPTKQAPRPNQNHNPRKKR